MIVSLAPPGEDFADREYALKYRPKEAGIIGQEIVCRYVLNFLNAYLKGDGAALRFINGKPEEQGIPAGVVVRDFKAGLKAPTEEEFYTIILETKTWRSRIMRSHWK